METLESKMASLETPPQVQQESVSVETIENVFARLTLLENNYQLVKSQVNTDLLKWCSYFMKIIYQFHSALEYAIDNAVVK